MSLELKPYPEYRDSGLPWLGEIPAHWEAERAKWLFKKMDRPVEPSDATVTCFRDGVVTLRKNRRTEGFTESLQEIGYQGVRRGDLVIHAMDAFAGAIGVSDSDGKCTPVYAVCEPRRDANPHYYARVVRETARTLWITALAKGIRERSTDFRYEAFANQVLPVPPVEEQERVVAFLDRTDGVTNRLIRTKQRLIELLNEQKQTVIHRAVTRGLDPDAPMKSTSLDWLPEVPEHWSVAALRMRYSVELGKMLDAKRITGQHSMPYLRNVDVQWDFVNTTDLPTMDIETHEYERYTLRPGDMLVCEGGEVGRSAFWRRELALCGFQKALHRVRSLNPESDLPRFLYYLMYATAKLGLFQSGGNESTIAHLTGEKLRAQRFPFPPREEQEEIVHHLDDASRHVEGAIQRARREIELIREYRMRLISDVVTGKLDVRGVKLPEDEGVGANPDGLESVATEGSPDPEEVPDAVLRYQ